MYNGGEDSFVNGLVSIIIPIYNAGRTLRTSILPILNQSYRNIEIILIDDGSNDDTYSICEELVRTNSKIKVFHTNNNGSGAARNYGILHSKGDYLYFPDADDGLNQNAIEIMVKGMLPDCDLVVFGFDVVDRKNRIIRQKIYQNSIQDGETIRKNYSDYINMSDKWAIQGAPWNKLFKRDIIIDNTVEFPLMRRHQDEGFITRYMCYAEKVHFISPVLYTYHMNDIRMEWDKYKPDYITNVVELYELRKNTILLWNPDDQKTKKAVDKAYICKFIKALELSFSSRMRFNPKQRIEWVREQIDRYHFKEMNYEVGLAKYQFLVCQLIKRGNIKLAVCLMRIKVISERLGVLQTFNLYHR